MRYGYTEIKITNADDESIRVRQNYDGEGHILDIEGHEFWIDDLGTFVNALLALANSAEGE